MIAEEVQLIILDLMVVGQLKITCSETFPLNLLCSSERKNQGGPKGVNSVVLKTEVSQGEGRSRNVVWF